jgi:ATP/maltotriose-dependent transcriptional regulator MalT
VLKELFIGNRVNGKAIEAALPLKGNPTDAPYPARRHIIERPRLTGMLDRTDASVVLFVAPAGYGKTTLARQWTTQGGRRGAWVSGSNALADPAALAERIAVAVDQLMPGAADAMRERAQIVDGSREDTALLAEILARDVAEWEPDSWVVIDDYHEAIAENATESFVERLVTGSSIKVLVTSRVRPQWATPRRLLYGEVFEVGQSLLSMDGDEAAAVLATGDAAPLPGLASLADGWPAVIGLAAMTRAVSIPEEAFAERLYSFFAEEMYRALPTGAATGLTLLSTLPTITEDLAALLTPGSTDVLSVGLSSGLLTHQGQTYEMHPLLREFFRHRLDEVDARPERSAVAQAIHMLMESRDWDAAFALASGMGSTDDLTEVLEAELDSLLAAGRLATLEEHAETARARQSSGGIAYLIDAEVAFRRGESQRARRSAERAARAMEPHHQMLSRTLFRAAQAAYFVDESYAAIELSVRAEETAELAADVSNARWIRYLAAAELELRDVDEFASQVQAAVSDAPDDVLRAASVALTQDARFAADEAALAAGEDAMSVADDASPLVRTAFLSLLGRALIERGRYTDGLSAIARGLEDAERMRIDFAKFHLQLGLAYAHIGLGDLAHADQALTTAERFATDAHMYGNWSLARGKLSLSRRRVDEARHLFEQVDRVRDSATVSELAAYAGFAAASQGDRETAIRWANHAREVSATIEPSVIAALTMTLAAQRPRDVRTSAETAITLVEERGHVNHLVLAMSAQPRLLRAIEQLQPSMNSRVSAAIRIVRNRRPNNALTPREHEVLTMMAAGLRNREIASQLFISEVTVKAHVRHILEKLGVPNRAAAVARAFSQAAATETSSEDPPE